MGVSWDGKFGLFQVSSCHLKETPDFSRGVSDFVSFLRLRVYARKIGGLENI
jgi:hypothetical protein